MSKTYYFLVLSLFIITCAAVLFCLGCPAGGSSFDPEEGLIHYYPFSGNADDQGSDPKDGTVNGATLVADKDGNPNSAYDFDGGDTISLEYFAPLSPCTISAWINTADAAGVILDWVEAPGGLGTEEEAFGISLSNLFHAKSTGIMSDSVESNTAVDTGTWVHVALVINGTNSALYINGSFDNSDDVTGALADLDTLTIGNNLTGIIDEIRIYDRALSAGKVEKLSEM